MCCSNQKFNHFQLGITHTSCSFFCSSSFLLCSSSSSFLLLSSSSFLFLSSSSFFLSSSLCCSSLLLSASLSAVVSLAANTINQSSVTGFVQDFSFKILKLVPDLKTTLPEQVTTQLHTQFEHSYDRSPCPGAVSSEIIKKIPSNYLLFILVVLVGGGGFYPPPPPPLQHIICQTLLMKFPKLSKTHVWICLFLPPSPVELISIVIICGTCKGLHIEIFTVAWCCRNVFNYHSHYYQ